MCEMKVYGICICITLYNTTIKQIKDELNYKSSQELIELCLKLSKFKKENKELLSYLLFDVEDEVTYIYNVNEYSTLLFADINTKSFFYIRKSVRKILKLTKKYIRYSKKKETEVELLLHFCKELKKVSPSISKSPRLLNVYNRQIILIKKAIATLHEDLQYDYQLEFDQLLDE